MSWTRLDDGFHSHPKIEAAGNAAVGAFARALSYCAAYATGGFVPASWAGRVASRSELDKLVSSGLWEKVAAGEVREVVGRRDTGGRALPDAEVTMPADGYFIPDFLHFNWTKTEAENLKIKRREAGRAGGQAKAEALAPATAGATAPALAPATGFATTPRPDPSRPVEDSLPAYQTSEVGPARARVSNGSAGGGDDLDFGRIGTAVQDELERLRGAK